jgi:divalent metal cation (Fe/Co/Zn/Cd) transporter
MNPGNPQRAINTDSAVRLEYLTLGWMGLEFASSLALGVLSGSLLLLAFGIDSLIELASATVVLWRLRAEFGGGVSDERVDSVERRAARFTGYLLVALAAYVAASSAYGLLVGHTPNLGESVWGLVIGVVALLSMPLLAKYKRVLAAPNRLNSKALRADAAEAISCAYLSAVLMVGLLLSRLLGWWWIDSAAALLLIPFVILEGREALSGEAEEG